MNDELLIRLSNADSIASNEDEVRKILFNELSKFSTDVSCDNLGSVIFHRKCKKDNALKIMFCAHMDEVGFMVRSISDIGFIYLMQVGGVQDKSKEMQEVRITTFAGKKIYGILNVTKSENGKVKDMYVDIGCDSADEVKMLGIEIGNMVCFASKAQKSEVKNMYMGKAMDDRAGCYALAEAMKRIKDDNENDIYFVGTSSEEVGTRGGKTATYKINPDIVFAVDVANNPELVRDYSNHRILGNGPMVLHYDKGMSPNLKLIKYIENLADKMKIPYQKDMFKGGGTDASTGHLERDGRLGLVLGIPLRYCHGSYSYVNMDDLENLINLIVCICENIKYKDYFEFINFLGGNTNDRK